MWLTILIWTIFNGIASLIITDIYVCLLGQPIICGGYENGSSFFYVDFIYNLKWAAYFHSLWIEFICVFFYTDLTVLEVFERVSRLILRHRMFLIINCEYFWKFFFSASILVKYELIFIELFFANAMSV
jgi:hypothetical protein